MRPATLYAISAGLSILAAIQIAVGEADQPLPQTITSEKSDSGTQVQSP